MMRQPRLLLCAVLGATAVGGALVPGFSLAGPPGQGEQPTPDTGPLTVEQSISPNPSNVGDELTLHLDVRYPKGYRVNLPTGLDLGPGELLSVDESSPERADGELRKTFDIHFQAFELDEVRLPPVTLTYTDPDGQVVTVDAPRASFTVERLTANEAEPERQAEDPPVSLTYPNLLAERMIWAALAALVVGAGLAAAFFSLRKRKPTVAAAPPQPPHELALAALRALEDRRLSMLEVGAFQDYYLELTAIAKQYVQDRFNVDVVERTTDELHMVMRRERGRMGGLDPDDLLAFLREADLIKFARLSPTPGETEAALRSVEGIVLRTRPRDGVSAASASSNGPAPVAASVSPPSPEPPSPEPPPPEPPSPEPPSPPEPSPSPEPSPPSPSPPSGGLATPGGPSAPDMTPGPSQNPFRKDDRKDVA